MPQEPTPAYVRMLGVPSTSGTSPTTYAHTIAAATAAPSTAIVTRFAHLTRGRRERNDALGAVAAKDPLIRGSTTAAMKSPRGDTLSESLATRARTHRMSPGTNRCTLNRR